MKFKTTQFLENKKNYLRDNYAKKTKNFQKVKKLLIL